jgi:predicted DCC family thiol-disulfide oxidoreductase YuxK
MLTALYDGHCVICNTTRRIIIALDWRKCVEWLDLHQHETIASRFPDLDHQRLMGEIHVIDPKGQIFGGFHGMRRMLRELPAGLPLYVLLRLPLLGDWLGPRVYRFIARHRYRINRLLGVELEQVEREEALCDEGVCKLPH